MFVLVGSLAWLIPDVPKGLEIQIKREIYVAKEAVRGGDATDEFSEQDSVRQMLM